TADALGYSSGTWGTYRQWSEAGAQVRKGEKAAYIVFYKEITVASEPTDSDESSTRLFARATPVFAAEQVDGYQAPVIDPLPATVISPIEHAEAFVAATGAIIEHGCSRAFYRPSADAIHMPPRQAFTGSHPGNFVQWRGAAVGLIWSLLWQSRGSDPCRRSGLNRRSKRGHRRPRASPAIRLTLVFSASSTAIFRSPRACVASVAHRGAGRPAFRENQNTQLLPWRDLARLIGSCHT
ncbi:MAG: ArdC-like ssDNA-binding domain-containing protein, partial [Methylocystis sp.]